MPPAASRDLGAVLFDLDGTLVNSEPINVESVVLAVRRHGHELGPQERHFVIGHSWNEIHALIVRRFALDLPMETLIAEAVEEKRLLVERAGLPELPGAVKAVRRLQQRAPLAVVSGASRVEVKDAVEGLGITDAFQFLMGAEDYQRGKPHPEPYLMAIARLGVPAAACLVLEDSTPGIQAARAAGTRVVAVRAGNYSDADQSAAHAIVDTLDQVDEALIARLLAD